MQIYKYVTIQATIPIACEDAALDYDDEKILRDLASRAVREDPAYVARMLSVVCHKTSVDDSAHMTEVWAWAAEILAQNASETLDLSEVGSLSVEVADILARVQGDYLNLGGLTHMSGALARSLAAYEGCLGLRGISELSDEAAEALGTHVGDLDLGGLTELTDGVATGLSRLRGCLFLDGLRQISETAAAVLAQRQEGLSATGLETLSPTVAELLVRAHPGDVIALPLLRHISTGVAHVLGKHAGGLALDGISSLSDEAVVALTRQGSRHLSLRGLEGLSDSAAAAIASHDGRVALDGISRLSDAAARALANHRGRLSLMGLLDVSEDAAAALRSNVGISLPEPLRSPGHSERSRIRDLLLSAEENDVLLGLQLYEQLPAASKDDDYVLCDSVVSDLRGHAHYWLNGDGPRQDLYTLYHRVVVAPVFLSRHAGCIDLVQIPSGSFTMGSPAGEPGRGDDEDRVLVDITNPFAMGRTVITVGQWRAVMGTEPWLHVPVEGLGGQHDDCPACCLTWHDAVRFCATLTRLERLRGSLGAHQVFRLPTEAEWEYACRAGTVTAYSFGDDPALLVDYAWSQEDPRGRTVIHRAGSKKPNPWGLADMHGNISEWCADWYAPHRQGGANPTGASQGTERVCRGGGRTSPASGCRSATRERYAPDYLSYIGFRVIQTA